MLISQLKLLCIINAGKNRWILIGVALAAAILILCPLLLCVAKRKQKYARKGTWILQT